MKISSSVENDASRGQPDHAPSLEVEAHAHDPERLLPPEDHVTASNNTPGNSTTSSGIVDEADDDQGNPNLIPLLSNNRNATVMRWQKGQQDQVNSNAHGPFQDDKRTSKKADQEPNDNVKTPNASSSSDGNIQKRNHDDDPDDDEEQDTTLPRAWTNRIAEQIANQQLLQNANAIGIDPTNEALTFLIPEISATKRQYSPAFYPQVMALLTGSGLLHIAHDMLTARGVELGCLGEVGEAIS
ncbi:unnamed protein product, partial [Amoebophrya sp. A25]|eukprot:GSA25T00026163001.1